MLSDNTPPNFQDNLFKKKGKGEEDIYFTRKDKEALSALMEKMNKVHYSSDEEPDEVLHRHRDRLNAIFRENNVTVSSALVEDLLRWKRGEI